MAEKYYDIEAYLKQFTPKQWLEAMINLYQDNNIGIMPVEMLRIGFNLAGPDGWKTIAPFWMKEFETESIKPLEEFKNE